MSEIEEERLRISGMYELVGVLVLTRKPLTDEQVSTIASYILSIEDK